MCCTWLAENTGHKKLPSGHHRTTLLGLRIFANKACINYQKKSVKQQYLIHMSSSQYGELRPILTAEIGSRVWGTAANFNGYHTKPVEICRGAPNRQRISAVSRPKFTILSAHVCGLWRRYCCLTSFFRLLTHALVPKI